MVCICVETINPVTHHFSVSIQHQELTLAWLTRLHTWTAAQGVEFTSLEPLLQNMLYSGSIQNWTHNADTDHRSKKETILLEK